MTAEFLDCQFDTGRANKPRKADDRPGQKTQYANLIRYRPSEKYFARIRIAGKLIRQSLNTTVLSVLKLRLADSEKKERQLAERQTAVAGGRMTVGDALKVYRERLKEDASLKPRTWDCYEQRIKALLKDWPALGQMEIRDVTKTACLNRAASFSQGRSATVFYHTVGILRGILEIGVEVGARYDNPARFIKQLSERSRKPQPTEIHQFDTPVAEIENGGSGFSRPCAELVRFVAYGGSGIRRPRTPPQPIPWGERWQCR